MISPAAGASVYEQIAAALRDQIISGQLAPGQPVPSERTLEQEYGVSRVTVQRAMRILRSEGLVVVSRGHRGRVRDEPERQDLTIPPGAVLTARMPTTAERAQHDIGEGVPVFVVTLPDGTVEAYPADRWQLRQAG